MNSRLSNSEPVSLTQQIKAEAHSLGFFACGVAKAAPVDDITAGAYRGWVEAGMHAGMDYLCRNTEKRLNPTLLMEGARSIIVVALNYTPAARMPEDQYQIAAYAYGADYHDIMRSKLGALAEFANACTGGRMQYRAFCDTAPVLERYWAEKAGLGWTGRNHQLIIPHAGSMFFLGELLVDICLDYDTQLTPRCGTCRRCIDACPTGALTAEGGLDCRRCLSYQTIENRGDIPPDIAQAMGNCIYGCDRCQNACPWNRFAQPSSEPSLRPRPELLAMTKHGWHTLSRQDYQRMFKGSAVKRAKYEGLVRNIKAAETSAEKQGNTGVPQI